VNKEAYQEIAHNSRVYKLAVAFLLSTGKVTEEEAKEIASKELKRLKEE